MSEQQQLLPDIIVFPDIKPKQILASFDLEKGDGTLKKQSLAIGVVVGDENGIIIFEKCYARPIDMVKKDADEKCWDGFWSDKQDLLKRLQTVAKPTWLQEFYNDMKSLEKQFGPFGKYLNKTKKGCEFTWIMDNPWDFATISHELFTSGICTEMPLNYMFTGYVSSNDPTEQRKGLTYDERKMVNSMIKTKATHWPVDDAKKNYEMRVAIHQILKNREKTALQIADEEAIALEMQQATNQILKIDDGDNDTISE